MILTGNFTSSDEKRIAFEEEEQHKPLLTASFNAGVFPGPRQFAASFSLFCEEHPKLAIVLSRLKRSDIVTFLQ